MRARARVRQRRVPLIAEASVFSVMIQRSARDPPLPCEERVSLLSCASPARRCHVHRVTHTHESYPLLHPINTMNAYGSLADSSIMGSFYELLKVVYPSTRQPVNDVDSHNRRDCKTLLELLHNVALCPAWL